MHALRIGRLLKQKMKLRNLPLLRIWRENLERQEKKFVRKEVNPEVFYFAPLKN
jgi:hypothetical protein